MAGFTLGAKISDAEFLNKMNEAVRNIKDMVWENKEDTSEEELYYGKLTTEHSKKGGTYELENVKKLEIDVIAGEIKLESYHGQEIEIEVEHDHSKYVKVSTGDDYMKIESTKTFHGGDIKIRYPENLLLEQLKIEVDAGEVELENAIYVKELMITIGAGEFQADEMIYADSVYMEVGAGEIDIEKISADHLSGNCGVGEITFMLDGREEDYNYSLECGLGEITIGENSHSSIADRVEIDHGNAERIVNLSCGLGEITANFTR